MIREEEFGLTTKEKETILIELLNRKVKLYREFELEKDDLTKACISNEIVRLTNLIRKIAQIF